MFTTRLFYMLTKLNTIGFFDSLILGNFFFFRCLYSALSGQRRNIIPYYRTGCFVRFAHGFGVKTLPTVL